MLIAIIIHYHYFLFHICLIHFLQHSLSIQKVLDSILLYHQYHLPLNNILQQHNNSFKKIKNTYISIDVFCLHILNLGRYFIQLIAMLTLYNSIKRHSMTWIRQLFILVFLYRWLCNAIYLSFKLDKYYSFIPSIPNSRILKSSKASQTSLLTVFGLISNFSATFS